MLLRVKEHGGRLRNYSSWWCVISCSVISGYLQEEIHFSCSQRLQPPPPASSVWERLKHRSRWDDHEVNRPPAPPSCAAVCGAHSGCDQLTPAELCDWPSAPPLESQRGAPPTLHWKWRRGASFLLILVPFDKSGTNPEPAEPSTGINNNCIQTAVFSLMVSFAVSWTLSHFKHLPHCKGENLKLGHSAVLRVDFYPLLLG